MRARSLATAACMLVATLVPAVGDDTEPTRAGREGRAALDALLAKQRHDREVQAAQPKPAIPQPRRAPSPAGRKLPAICIGCGAALGHRGRDEAPRPRAASASEGRTPPLG